MTLPTVDGAMFSFHAPVGAFGRRSVIHISFDTLRIQSLEAADLPAVGAGYQELSVPIAAGGLIEAGQHLVRLRYLSDPETEPKPANFINVDDVSFTATPLPVSGRRRLAAGRAGAGRWSGARLRWRHARPGPRHGDQESPA